MYNHSQIDKEKNETNIDGELRVFVLTVHIHYYNFSCKNHNVVLDGLSQ